MTVLRITLVTALLLTGIVRQQPSLAVTRDAPIRVGVYENKPKVFLDQEGNPAGFWPELLNAIAEPEDWTLEYVPCEWEQCLQAIETGELDLMVDVSYSAERATRFDFNQEVVISSWSVVYVRRGEHLNSILDLDQKRLGVLTDSIQSEELTRQVESFGIDPHFVEVGNYDLLLRLLAAGVVEAAVINRFRGAVAETQYPIAPTNVLVAPSQLHFIVPQGSHGDLLVALDRQLRVLQTDSNSLYYRLIERWLEPTSPLRWGEVRQWLLGLAICGLVTGTAVVIGWNRSLKREMARRQQTEQALQESQSWLRRAMAVAEIICWEEDLQTETIRFFGKQTPQGWVAASWQTSSRVVLQKLVPPEDRQRLQTAREQALNNLSEMAIEHRLRIAQQEIWVFAIGQPITDAQGIPRKLVGVSLNITARKQTALSLQKNEEQLRLALELTQIAIWDWQVDSDRVEWNDNHYRLMGYEPGAVPADYQRWHQAVHPEDRARVQQAIEDALHTQTEYVQEYRLVTPDGHTRWVLARGCGLQNDQGQTVRMLGMMLDITQRKETEAALHQSEATNRQILQAIPDLLIWVTLDGTYIGSAGGSGIFDLCDPGDIIGKNQFEILPPAIAQARQQATAAMIRTGQSQVYEQIVQIGDTLQYEEVRLVPVEGDKVLTIIRNISDRKQAELALADSERRYRLVTENMTDLVGLHRPDGQYLYVTPSCQTLLGYTQAELMGRSLLSCLHPEDRDRVETALATTLQGTPFLVTYRIQTKAGGYIWLETFIKGILDDAGQVLHLQTTSRDVSDRVFMEQRLRHDALHDALTGLPNRHLLLERLELALKWTKRQPVLQAAVLFLDFDNFKVINDSLGHAVGDHLLTTLAQKFKHLLRETDLVARFGGDEFVILLEELTSFNEAIQVAERILEDLRSPILLQEQRIFISASIGIVAVSLKHQTAEALLRDADIAMYRAKANGRGSYAVFDPQMHAQVLQRLQLETELRHALERQEFVLYYQPIVALRTLKLVGFEALLRWQHAQLGIVPPAQFIDVVEETDLIVPLGQWVLQEACQQLARWQRSLPTAQPLKLTVNLSVKQLKPAILLPQIDAVLAQSGIAAQSLTLEITESLLVQNIDATTELLSQLQARGVSISVDDFGTGYSSLSYLHQLPVDALKIDRSFVSPIEPTAKNQTIAEAIVVLSNLLELSAIAEGIETQQQLQWLQTLNCEYGQGYLFSPPVNADGAQSLIQQGLQICQHWVW